MDWPTAFTVVGCLWAVVVLLCIKTTDQKEQSAEISFLRERIRVVEKEIEWLTAMVKKP